MFCEIFSNENQDTNEKKTEFRIYNLKKIVRQNLNDTSFHAVNNIYNLNDTFLKTFIFICFIGSGGLCFYLTVQAFADYLSFNVLISNKIVSEIPAECIFI
jgi:hypothetical protein